MYVMTTSSLDKDLGLDLLTKALSTVTEEINKRGGKIDVKMAPKVHALTRCILRRLRSRLHSLFFHNGFLLKFNTLVLYIASELHCVCVRRSPRATSRSCRK
jgi:hypothetical protein